MKNFTKLLSVLFFTIIALQVSAQKKDFSAVDNYVKSLGSLDTLNMGTISYVITKKFPDNLDKVRAIFDWIAYNINFDLKAAKANNNDKSGSDIILKTRKATAAGYAALFQDMCSVVKIRCLTVDGWVKNNVEQIGEKPDEFNHTWAVVQLGQSPETWFYVDPTWGSGYTDEKMTTYTKSFNDNYFFANKTIFNFQHFPDNMAWQLGNGSKNIKEFINTPLVKETAYNVGLSSYAPDNGYIKTKSSKAVQFSIKISDTVNVQIVSLVIGPEKKKKTKTVDYTFTEGKILFSYKFDEEDTYPVTVLINNKPVLAYFAEVVE
ncbi:transglutaminase domain-containing protein [Ferruginibacter sp. SUN002]|uniref:transglutaminase domain-containing protein n=1 Tax=Ferruginibacter sp. SUN002 TaxID=2937789 RepID=UPI003D36E96D